jgi:predicted enzyme related to lactoylglutathione lyase
MTIRTSPWPEGVPCWTDLMAPDVGVARSFYEAVVGWTFEGTGDEYGGYVIASVKGAAAAGVGPMQEGARPAWTLYFAAGDADAAASTVVEMGGTVVVPPGDVGPLGRMFVAVDPTGAPFGVWQAGQHIGAGIVNESGGLTWEDLHTTDPDASRSFFAGLFGFRYEEIPDAGDYRIVLRPGEDFPIGGIGPLVGEEGPPHWIVYFGVPDADAAVAAAESGGGSVLVPPYDSPYGRMAGLADPAGATFMVVQDTSGTQPDRSG